MKKEVKDVLKSFTYAFSGLKYAFKYERNFFVHIMAMVYVLIIGHFSKISALEFAIVLLCIALVLSAELVNTVIEKLCDFVSAEKREEIKVIKDISAAFVLITAIASVLVAVFIFYDSQIYYMNLNQILVLILIPVLLFIIKRRTK